VLHSRCNYPLKFNTRKGWSKESIQRICRVISLSLIGFRVAFSSTDITIFCRSHSFVVSDCSVIAIKVESTRQSTQFQSMETDLGRLQTSYSLLQFIVYGYIYQYNTAVNLFSKNIDDGKTYIQHHSTFLYARHELCCCALSNTDTRYSSTNSLNNGTVVTKPVSRCFHNGGMPCCVLSSLSLQYGETFAPK
jgi:hypothetical protein